MKKKKGFDNYWTGDDRTEARKPAEETQRREKFGRGRKWRKRREGRISC